MSKNSAKANEFKPLKSNKIKEPLFDRVFYAVTFVLLCMLLVIIIYPLWFVVMASCTDPVYVNNGAMLLYPKGFTDLAYKRVLTDAKIWMGYGNTIFYTLCGTVLGLFLTTIAGYALSREDMPGRGIIMKAFVFTMYFGGGMIPFYLVVKNLHLLDTRFCIIILGCLSVYNIILVRSYFMSSVPKELYEAASIDGCGNTRYMFTIAIPLAKAIIAVIALYLAVGYWNSYFNAMIFLSDYTKYPLQLFLREILLTSSTSTVDTGTDPNDAAKLATMNSVIKYAVIVVTTVPIICVYPFIQKYFVQGVMIGSIKG